MYVEIVCICLAPRLVSREMCISSLHLMGGAVQLTCLAHTELDLHNIIKRTAPNFPRCKKRGQSMYFASMHAFYHPKPPPLKTSQTQLGDLIILVASGRFSELKRGHMKTGSWKVIVSLEVWLQKLRTAQQGSSYVWSAGGLWKPRVSLSAIFSIHGRSGNKPMDKPMDKQVPPARYCSPNSECGHLWSRPDWLTWSCVPYMCRIISSTLLDQG